MMPTNQGDEIRRRGLAAAVDVLWPLYPSNGPLPGARAVASGILRAIDAVWDATAGANDAFDKDGDVDLYVEIEPLSIVATALWYVSLNNGMDLDEVSPNAQGAQAFIGFAQAAVFLETLQNAHYVAESIIQDFGLSGEGCVTEALEKLASMPEEDQP